MATTDKYPGPWICSVCGSARISQETIQDSMDPDHPLGLCVQCHPITTIPNAQTDPQGHRDAVNAMAQKPPRSRLAPLIRPEEWASMPGAVAEGKPKAPKHEREAVPPDMWAGQLPEKMNPPARR